VKTLHAALLVSLLLAPWLPGRAEVPEKAPPTPDFPTTDTTVSLLEPVNGQCEWSKLDPLTSTRRVLARLAADCQGGSTALSRDGKRGAVRFWRGAVSMPIVGRPTFPEPFPSSAFRDRLFLVDLTTGAVEELPLPPNGELIEYGFDPGGRLVGLSLEQADAPAQERSQVVEIDGRSRSPSGRAPKLVAHGFAFLGGMWLRMESKPASDGLGTASLDLRKELGERSIRALDPRYEALELEDDEVLDQLYDLSPEQPEGEWTEFRSGVHSMAVWGTPFGNDMLATGLIRRLEKGGQVVALPGNPYRPNDMISLRTRGPYLLLSLADSGAHPRLYRGRKLLWTSESARAVTLWPK
jgi:hypothetical protein